MKKLLVISVLFITATSFKKQPDAAYTQYWVVSARLTYDDVPGCNKWLVSNVAPKTSDCQLTDGVDRSYIKYYTEKYKSKCGLIEVMANSYKSPDEAEAYRTKLIKEFEDKKREVFLTDGFAVPCQ
jgi:hypothetical protein